MLYDDILQEDKNKYYINNIRLKKLDSAIRNSIYAIGEIGNTGWLKFSTTTSELRETSAIAQEMSPSVPYTFVFDNVELSEKHLKNISYNISVKSGDLEVASIEPNVYYEHINSINESSVSPSPTSGSGLKLRHKDTNLTLGSMVFIDIVPEGQRYITVRKFTSLSSGLAWQVTTLQHGDPGFEYIDSGFINHTFSSLEDDYYIDGTVLLWGGDDFYPTIAGLPSPAHTPIQLGESYPPYPSNSYSPPPFTGDIITNTSTSPSGDTELHRRRLAFGANSFSYIKNKDGKYKISISGKVIFKASSVKVFKESGFSISSVETVYSFSNPPSGNWGYSQTSRTTSPGTPFILYEPEDIDVLLNCSLFWKTNENNIILDRKV